MKKLTVYFIIAVIIVIAVFDAYLIITKGLDNSISHVLIMWGYKYPITSFLFGVVVGHLYWRMRDTKETKEITEFIEKEK